VTFVEQSAAPTVPGPTPPRQRLTLTRRTWVALAAVVIVVAAVGGFFGWRQTHQRSDDEISSGYSQDSLDALQAWASPAGFREIKGTWGCQVDAASRCFVTTRSGTGLARDLAQQLHSPSINWSVAGPDSVWGDSFWMCAAVGPSTVALVGVHPYVENATETSPGAWSLKPGAQPKLHGSVMSVSLYGTSSCTTQAT
jgi:hypothetical protein